MSQAVIKRNVEKTNASAKVARTVGKVVLTTWLSIFSLVMLYPLVFMLLIGLFKAKELNMTPIGLFPWPKDPTLDNILLIFQFVRTMPNFGNYLFNSLARTALSVVSTCITTMICGYVFSRIKFKGSRNLLLFLIMVTFLPGTLSLIPTYIIYLRLGIYDTWWVYAIGAPGINIMGTFVTKQFMDTLPSSLDESAKIDGANTFTIMFKILFPLCLPIMAYQAIGTGIGTWNDWSTSFYFTASDNLKVIPGVLADMSVFKSAQGMPNYPAMVAIGMIVMVPSLVIFLFFQKYIIEGMAHTGLKG